MRALQFILALAIVFVVGVAAFFFLDYAIQVAQAAGAGRMLR